MGESAAAVELGSAAASAGTSGAHDGARDAEARLPAVGEGKQRARRRRRRSSEGGAEGPPQCYVLRSASERERLLTGAGRPESRSLVGWQQRQSEAEARFQRAREVALTRAHSHNEWVAQRIEAQLGNSAGSVVSRARRRDRAAFEAAVAATDEVVETRHPRRYTVGGRFDAALAGGRWLRGTVVAVNSSFESPSITVRPDAPAGYLAEAVSAYDLDSRLQSIAALDQHFGATLQYIAEWTAQEEERQRTALAASAQRLVGAYRRTVVDACSEARAAGPECYGIAAAGARVAAAGALVQDARLYAELTARYREFDSDLFATLEYPGRAFRLRLSLKARVVARFVAGVAARRRAERCAAAAAATRLQALWRGETGRRKALARARALRLLRELAWQATDVAPHLRQAVRCLSAWKRLVVAARATRFLARQQAGSFSASLQRRCFVSWRARARATTAALAALRSLRLRCVAGRVLRAWQQVAAVEIAIRALQARIATRRARDSFETWALATAQQLADRRRKRSRAATEVQRVWRGWRGRQCARKLHRGLLLAQAWLRGWRTRREWNRPRGMRHRLGEHRRRRLARERKSIDANRARKAGIKTGVLAVAASSSVSLPSALASAPTPSAKSSAETRTTPKAPPPLRPHGYEFRAPNGPLEEPDSLRERVLERINFFAMLVLDA
jgi:hypothetical protein